MSCPHFEYEFNQVKKNSSFYFSDVSICYFSLFYNQYKLSSFELLWLLWHYLSLFFNILYSKLLIEILKVIISARPDYNVTFRLLDLWFRSIRCLRNIIHWNLITTFILRNVMWFLLQLIDHNIHESNEVTGFTHVIVNTRHCQVILGGVRAYRQKLFQKSIHDSAATLSDFESAVSFPALVSINNNNLQLFCGDELFLDVRWRVLSSHRHCNDLFNW